MCFDYVSRNCSDPSCKNKVFVPSEYTGLVLCETCKKDFEEKIMDNSSWKYNKSTFVIYMEEYGNKKERIDKICKDILRELIE